MLFKEPRFIFWRIVKSLGIVVLKNKAPVHYTVTKGQYIIHKQIILLIQYYVLVPKMKKNIDRRIKRMTIFKSIICAMMEDLASRGSNLRHLEGKPNFGHLGY